MRYGVAGRRGRRHARVRRGRRSTDAGARRVAARLAAVADGTGAAVAGVARERHDYGQVALIAKVWRDAPHDGVAYERFTPDGPIALLPEGDHYGLVWTMTPARARASCSRCADARVPRRARAPFRHARAAASRACADRRTFPLALEFARPTVARALRRCSATPRRRCIRSPARASTSACATRASSRRSILDTPRDALGERAMLARYAARRRTDRCAGIAFTHGLVSVFGNDCALLRWPRGLALTLLDARSAGEARIHARDAVRRCAERAFARATRARALRKNRAIRARARMTASRARIAHDRAESV